MIKEIIGILGLVVWGLITIYYTKEFHDKDI